MFEYIKGNLTMVSPDFVVVETGGIGFKIMVSRSTMNALPEIEQSAFLCLHPVYREDDISLYGFETEEERELFRTLITISGIGPKAAMAMLSQFTEQELIRYILNGDSKSIAKAPGIGKKTAERIILELKDKYKGYQPQAADDAVGALETMRASDNLFNEAVNGLLGLGFPYAQAARAVERVIKPEMQIEEVLQHALLTVNN